MLLVDWGRISFARGCILIYNTEGDLLGRRVRNLLRILVGLMLCGTAGAAQSEVAVEFNRDIRPIFSDKCYTCHGPDQGNRQTKLRFDVEAVAKADLGGRFGHHLR